MTPPATAAIAALDLDAWRPLVAPYERPDLRRSLLQVATTLGLLALCLYGTYRSLALPYAVTLLCALVTAGFLVRTFMLMHDCAHGSLFASRRANDALGFIAGVLTFTPYVQWRRDHVLHHASAGDLDRRGHGDVLTLTVREYVARTRWGRLKYRLYRHPLVLLGLGPLHLFVGQRYRPRSKATGDREVASVWRTNAAIVALAAACVAADRVQGAAAVYVPVFFFAGAAGDLAVLRAAPVRGYVLGAARAVGLRDRRARRQLVPAAAARCCSGCTGSIGLHHVHHLSPRVPNYRLQALPRRERRCCTG